MTNETERMILRDARMIAQAERRFMRGVRLERLGRAVSWVVRRLIVLELGILALLWLTR